MSTKFEELATRDAEPAAEPREERVSSRRFLLISMAGSDEPRAVSVDDEPITVGRGDAATVRVPSLGCSRLHARFESTPDGVVVTDLGSRNGTTVGGRRVRTATLRDGESAILGDVTATLVTVAGAHRPDEGEVVRVSRAMLAVQQIVERVAPSRLPVLILGETGTGKEVIAAEVHRLGGRTAAPMTVVNCAAIAPTLVESVLFGHVRGAFTGAIASHKGVFEQASGGTVFLDEVGELSPAAQASLLRVLDTNRVVPVGGTAEIDVDVRVVAATHRDLPAMVEAKAFRLDLYHRLNALTVAIPALRDRRDEIAPLAEHFAARGAAAWPGRVVAIARDAIDALQGYDWPGNVRELKNVIERAIVLGDGHTVTASDLPAHIRERRAPSVPPSAPAFPAGGLDLRAAVRDHEFALIRRALQQTNGHREQAARLLKLPLRTFERRVREVSALDADRG